MDEQKITETERFYNLIYDYLEINPMSVSEMTGVFVTITLEQLGVSDVQEGD